MSDDHEILVIGEDGNLYCVKAKEVSKITKPIENAELSPDVQATVEELRAARGGRIAQDLILISNRDILASTRSDILLSGATARLTTHATKMADFLSH